jgi:hypothetical protein
MRVSFLLLLGGCVAITACQGPDRTYVDATSSGTGGNSGTSSASGASGGGQNSGGGQSSGGGQGSGGGAATGSPCTKDAACASGVCADGFCCDRVCDGQCEACDVANLEGTCSRVTGTPHAPRATCGGSGPCAGTCDGNSTICTFPGAQTICGAACDGTCDGAGTCNSSSGAACPNGFACGASGCLTSCAGPQDCQPNFVCNGSACERVPESDCLDGIDNNGDGLADCEDPTCNAAVECVPAAPSGGELGVQSATGTCPADYPTAEVFHTGLQSGACSGCTCQTQCTATVRLYTGSACDTTAHQEVFTGPPTGSAADAVCKNFATVAYKSGTVTNPTPSGCVGGGTATQAPPTWATDDTFCAAKSSATCGDASKVCVARRTTDALCVRVDGAASCPVSYTSGANGVYYTGFNPGSCGSCSSCSPSVTNICKPLLLTPQVLDAPNCGGGATLLDSGCGSLTRSSYSSVKMGFSQSGTDGCTSNVTSIPPQPTGAVRICCQ